MRRLILGLILVACASSLASAQTLRVTADRTNLREKPATDAAIVVAVSKGDELEVIERAGNWYRVRVKPSGREGYVNSLLVETASAAQAPSTTPTPPSMPTTTPAPAPPPPSPSRAQPVGQAPSVMATGTVWAGLQDKPLDNAEIVKLTKLDMGDAVIIAKIKVASKVQFATGTDDLIRLKEAGVSKAVIAALLDRSGSADISSTAASDSAGASVTLYSKDGTVGLKSDEGAFNTIVAPFVGMKRYFRFPGLAASTRTADIRPSVTIEANRDPRTVYWMVKLDPDDDKEEMNRSLDIESPGMFGGSISSAPDGDQLIKCDQREEKPGVWRFTPLKDLKPGEYGIYFSKGDSAGMTYSFGVDKKRVP